MYDRLYKEFARDSQAAARRRERALIEHAIEKLEIAKKCGARSVEAFDALSFLRQLWTAFIVDLADDGNALPTTLRASLISIGLWIRKEIDRIESGQSENFDGLIEINQMIVGGLR
jgi:flagellar protein FlaF